MPPLRIFERDHGPERGHLLPTRRAPGARREVAEVTGWSVEIGRLIVFYSEQKTPVVDYRQPDGARLDSVAGQVVPLDRGRAPIGHLCFSAQDW